MNIQRHLLWTIIGGIFLTLLTPLFVTSSLFFPYISGKAFFFRSLVEIVFALWILLAWRLPAYRPQRSAWLYVLLALVGVTSLASILGLDPYHSFWSNFERMDGLLNILHLAAYCVVVASVFRSETLWRWLWRASLGVSLILCFHALGQLADHKDRLDATLGNPIYLAIYLVFHIYLAAILLAQSWRSVWRYLYGAIILFELFILYRTATRSALLGLAVGAVVSLVIVLIKRWSNLRVRYIALGFLVLSALSVGIFWLERDSQFVRNSPVLSRFADISLESGTSGSRFTIWQMSLKGFRERPVLGWGPENFGVVFNKYYEPKLWPQEQWFDRSHNVYIDWLIHAGILGLASYLSLFILTLYYLWRRESSLILRSLITGLLVAYAVHNFFVFDNLISSIFFFLIIAYLHQRTLPSLPPAKLAPAMSSGDWALVVMLAAGLITTLYIVNLKPLSAGSTLIQGLKASTLEEQLKLMGQVFDSDTFLNREAGEQLAQRVAPILSDSQLPPELRQQSIELSNSALEEQIERSPDDVRPRLILATFQLAAGDASAALGTMEEAIKLAPRKQSALFNLSAAQSGVGDQEAALATAEEAFRLDESYPEARKFYALNLIVNSQLEAANELLKDSSEDLALDERFVNAYVAIKRYDLALALWQRRVELNPNDPQAHFSLAAAYLLNNNRTAAIAALEKAAEIEPRAQAQVDKLIAEIRAGKNPLQK